ncbi:MAG TPA: hypothetical protein VK968_00300 [Roseimicrobium sp.]|nr:hypothetical protein [Roseimicrobium sp.]
MFTHRWSFVGCLLVVTSVACEEKKDPLGGMKFRDTYPPNQNRQVITDVKKLPPVVSGTLPLAYMIDFACTVRVMDEDKKIPLAAADARAGQIVSVDAKSGVIIGTNKALAGPMDPTRIYGIYLEPK